MIFFKRNIINSCDKCKLNVFIDCVVRSDYSGLGKGTRKQLTKAWNDIYNEYLKLSKNEAHLRIFQLYKEIGLLQAKYHNIQLSLSILSCRYNQRIIKDISKLGFSCKFPKDNKEQYAKDLHRVNSISKGWLVEIEIKTQELNRLIKNQRSEPITDNDFDNLLTELGRFQGYRLNKNEITVSEFVSATNSMNKEMKRRENELMNLRHK